MHILPLREIAGLYVPQETIEVSDHVDGIELDLVTHDVAKFFELMLKRNGYVLGAVILAAYRPHHAGTRRTESYRAGLYH